MPAAVPAAASAAEGVLFMTTPALLPPALPAIVLVDDSADDLFFIERIMRKQGITNPVVTFTDSTKAIVYFTDLGVHQSATPCAILTDLKMPKVDGFGLVEWIRTQRYLDGMYVGVISSSGFAQDRDRAERSGAQAYYTKIPPPLTLSTFVQVAMTSDRPSRPMVGRSEGEDNFRQW
jgi:CheY-like chemotaxis protein